MTMGRSGAARCGRCDSVKIRVDHLPRVVVLPAAARGTRWDFVESHDTAPDQ